MTVLYPIDATLLRRGPLITWTLMTDATLLLDCIQTLLRLDLHDPWPPPSSPYSYFISLDLCDRSSTACVIALGVAKHNISLLGLAEQPVK